MATSLVMHEEIQTTLARAKELRRVFDKLVTLGKRGDLHARRQVAGYLFNDEASKKLFTELPGRLESRNGGYTRILKMGPRFGDGAQLAKIQLVDYDHSKSDA